ncbi:MAG: thioesterase family protein [Pseudomonadota bacterium]
MTAEPDAPVEGHDGPYAAPIVTPQATVRPEWIDYNGHMNVAYYIVAMDGSLDWVLEHELGLGEGRVKRAERGPYTLQMHIHYLDEMLEGAAFYCRTRLLDHDAKRMHLFTEMVREADETVAATVEQLVINVDLTTRRSAPYPDWAQARLAGMAAAHAGLARPAQVGAILGIRRRG